MAELGLSNPPSYNPCSAANYQDYVKTFGNTDLVGDLLPIPHNLGKKPTIMSVIDEFGERIFISKWVDVDTNNSTLSLSGFLVTTNWTVRVV
jgi:hypothetical protein